MSYRDELLAALRTRCVHLKTKASFLGLPDPDDAPNDFDTAVWWCERTADALGPDEASAAPGPCGRAGRACYEPPRIPGV